MKKLPKSVQVANPKNSSQMDNCEKTLEKIFFNFLQKIFMQISSKFLQKFFLLETFLP